MRTITQRSEQHLQTAQSLAAASLSLLVATFAACSSNGSQAPQPSTTGGSEIDASDASSDGALSDAEAPDGDAGEAGAEGGGEEQAATTVRANATVLVADTGEGGAAHVDPDLINAWGLAFNPTNGILWVSSNGRGLLRLYNPDGTAGPFTVTVPLPAGDAGIADGGVSSAPTGQVFNPTTDFAGDKFIVTTENGTIAGWQAGTAAVTRVDQSANGAVYKGLTIIGAGAVGTEDAGADAAVADAAAEAGDAAPAPVVRRLCAANFFAAKIDCFGPDYGPATLPTGAFVDPNLPSGFAPYNVKAIGDRVFVAYAMQDQTKKDEEIGPGNGALSVFDTSGNFISRLVTGGPLNAPWGMALAPATFGNIGGSLLVGNFGDGSIIAIDPTSGALRANFTDANGNPFIIDGLWALEFGVDVPDAGESSGQLFFTAGPADETHGQVGRIDLAQ